MGDDWGTNATAVERLEPRRLRAGTPLQIFTFDTPAGPALDITGTAGRDRISIVATDAGLVIANKGGWSTTYPNTFALLRVNAARGDDRLIVDGSVTTRTILFGSNGDDTITGGGGADSIFGGFGRDRVLAGAGDDTIVSIGDSVLDRTTGGDGNDSFWTDDARTEIITDASADEIARNAVHRVGAFYAGKSVAKSAIAPGIARDLAGQDLPDPRPGASGMSYLDFTGLPLFATAGPLPTDVRQGAAGDCFFLAPLASVAHTDPDYVRQSVADLGDGTYAVRFYDKGAPLYVRVDADLPVRGSVSPAYASLGAEQSLWVAIVEKAYAFFRRGDGWYESLERGWMTEAFAALGVASLEIGDPSGAQDLLDRIQSTLDAGASMTWAAGDIPDEIPLVSSHAYSIQAVNVDAQGRAVSVVLRNPWGSDGAGNDDGADDGYVTLTGEQLFSVYWAVVYANV